MGIIWESFGGHLGIISKCCKDHVGVIWGSCLVRAGGLGGEAPQESRRKAGGFGGREPSQWGMVGGGGSTWILEDGTISGDGQGWVDLSIQPFTKKKQ